MYATQAYKGFAIRTHGTNNDRVGSVCVQFPQGLENRIECLERQMQLYLNARQQWNSLQGIQVSMRVTNCVEDCADVIGVSYYAKNGHPGIGKEETELIIRLLEYSIRDIMWDDLLKGL